MYAAPFLRAVKIVPERVDSWDEHPFSLPWTRDLHLPFRSPVTFFVGENGSGKSTLLKAIASLVQLPLSGGGRNERDHHFAYEDGAPLAKALRPELIRRPPDAYFFQAQHLAHFADMLDARRADPDFLGDPYARYGGKSLHHRSHGEALLDVITHRLDGGLYLVDEPEAALSPQRQLALLARMHDLVESGSTQFVIATHAPILMSYPGAQIISFDGDRLEPIELRDTSHFQITKGMLDTPERYWRHLTRG